MKKLDDKKLMELKNKHIKKYYVYQTKIDARKEIIKEINDEQVRRLLMKLKNNDKIENE